MTTNKPNNARAWIEAIELPNNSAFEARVPGNVGVYLFAATPFSAASVERETGGVMKRVSPLFDGRGPDEEPSIIYWVIGHFADEVNAAAVHIKKFSAARYVELLAAANAAK